MPSEERPIQERRPEWGAEGPLWLVGQAPRNEEDALVRAIVERAEALCAAHGMIRARHLPLDIVIRNTSVRGPRGGPLGGSLRRHLDISRASGLPLHPASLGRPQHLIEMLDKLLPVDPSIPHGVPAAIDRWLQNEIAGDALLHARDAAIRAAGADPASPPHWAFSIHPAGRALIEQLGLKLPVLDASPRLDGGTGRSKEIYDGPRWRNAEILYGRDFAGLSVVVTKPLTEATTGPLGANQAPTLFAMESRPDGLWIRLLGDWPDTHRAAFAKMRLHEIADVFPADTAAGKTRITSTQPAGINGLRLKLADTLVPLADPPAGIDQSWRSRSRKRAYDDKRRAPSA